MDKIKRYKDFKGRDYILDEVNDIVEGTLAYLSDEGFVFSAETLFNDVLIFINKIPKGVSPPFDYDPFSWLDVKEYVISLFERLEKAFNDFNIKAFIKIGSHYKSSGNLYNYRDKEITYKEMLDFSDDDQIVKKGQYIYGIRFCLS